MGEYNEQVAALLEEAAALIEQGWTQDRTHGVVFGRDVYCAIGAIDHVSMWGISRNSNVDGMGLLRSLAQDALMGIVGRNIAGWNDRPERTKQQVLDAFHKAAKAVRGVGEDAYTHAGE